MSAQARRIVIIGAGFGGLWAAREFERLNSRLEGVEVTLIDRNNYHLFVPLLYDVGTGGIEPGNICFPVRGVLKKCGTGSPVSFLECQALNVDLEKKIVSTDRKDLEYDYLVFAPGSITNYYGIPGVEQSIVPLKTINEGVTMHSRIVESFEAALLEADATRRHELLSFIIAGGGPTGVEIACVVADFVFGTLKRHFPGLVPHSHVILVEAGDSLMRGMNPKMGDLARKRLASRGVEVVLGCTVASASKTCIVTKAGELIPSRNIIWVTGIKAHPLTQALQVEKARDGRIVVNENLEVPSAPGLYVAGDCAYAINPHTSKPYNATAQVAMPMGTACARNITRAIEGVPQQPFTYKTKGDLVFLGRNYAVGEIAGQVVSGYPAFFLYEMYFISRLFGFKKKVCAWMDWTNNWFNRRNTEKLG